VRPHLGTDPDFTESAPEPENVSNPDVVVASARVISSWA
jgi:hypothetical protein